MGEKMVEPREVAAQRWEAPMREVTPRSEVLVRRGAVNQAAHRRFAALPRSRAARTRNASRV